VLPARSCDPSLSCASPCDPMKMLNNFFCFAPRFILDSTFLFLRKNLRKQRKHHSLHLLDTCFAPRPYIQGLRLNQILLNLKSKLVFISQFACGSADDKLELMRGSVQLLLVWEPFSIAIYKVNALISSEDRIFS
jgi:hypothetical protein